MEQYRLWKCVENLRGSVPRPNSHRAANGKEFGCFACSACSGDYEDPERTAEAADEENADGGEEVHR